MTLEEAINHAEEVSAVCDANCELLKPDIKLYASNKKCSEEHRQLAEWLKELQAYKECKLTDKEQRIFLSGMGREYEVCKEADDDFKHKHPYEDTLAWVCNQIEKKVKKALF